MQGSQELTFSMSVLVMLVFYKKYRKKQVTRLHTTLEVLLKCAVAHLPIKFFLFLCCYHHKWQNNSEARICHLRQSFFERVTICRKIKVFHLSRNLSRTLYSVDNYFQYISWTNSTNFIILHRRHYLLSKEFYVACILRTASIQDDTK